MMTAYNYAVFMQFPRSGDQRSQVTGTADIRDRYNTWTYPGGIGFVGGHPCRLVDASVVAVAHPMLPDASVRTLWRQEEET